MALFGFGYKKKIEEIKLRLDEQDYEAAAVIADGIPLQKLKSAYELNLVGKAYKCNGDFLQARNAFERSYEVRCARPVLIDIMDCCLETMELEGAEKYFDEYHKVAPDDKVTQYKYRYRIEKKKGRERRLLITILEELKALEYIEEYAYELAKQYHKAGMAPECMNECNDIILWFGFGPTVERAKTLLAYYKGEISLDEIKSAVVKQQTGYQKKEEKSEKKHKAQEAPEEAARLEEVEKKPPFDKKAMEIIEEPVAVEQELETIEEPMTVEQEEETAEELGAEVEEALEQQLTQILETEESLMDNSRGAEELYEPEAECVETGNERLTELLRRKKVSIPEILNNFGRIERIQKQVVKSLELALTDREKSYFVITGEPQTGKTTLALSFVRLLFELDIVKYDRTATIDAVQLNQVSRWVSAPCV